jgi:ferric-dicitrate binding protein FerR (iron transport regulator)
MRVAAMLLAISSITLLIYQAVNFAGEAQREFHASNGRMLVVTLQDGSLVTLNSGSTLKVSSDFQKRERSVELSGEAYFQVTKNVSKPFIVRAGSVSTRVLGTAFNVQAYKNDRLLTITVAEGKVRVNSRQTRLSQDLTPGKQLIYNKDRQTSKVGAVNAEHVSAWRSGTLYFDNESIPEIIKRLERKFDVTITATGKVRPDCRYTLRINDDTLEQTLRLLNKVAGISYQTNQQDQITINMALCK